MAVPQTVQLPDPAALKVGPDVRKYLCDLNAQIRAWCATVTQELSGTTGTGTLVIDDGTTKLTVTISRGRASDVATAASGGAGITWT